MDESLVLACLKGLHREIESDAGKDPENVTEDVCPLEGLSGFDSLLIPNVVRGLAKAMGILLPAGTRLRNPYKDPRGRGGLSLRHVARRFCQLYDRGER